MVFQPPHTPLPLSRSRFLLPPAGRQVDMGLNAIRLEGKMMDDDFFAVRREGWQAEQQCVCMCVCAADEHCALFPALKLTPPRPLARTQATDAAGLLVFPGWCVISAPRLRPFL